MKIIISSLEEIYFEKLLKLLLQGSYGWSLFHQGWYHFSGSNWREGERRQREDS